MKKVLTIIVAVGFVSSMMMVNTASASVRGGISPIWIPVAILSTLAAVTLAQPQQIVYERRVEYEPRQTVIYQEPRHYRHSRYYERDRDYDAPRYRDYR